MALKPVDGRSSQSFVRGTDVKATTAGSANAPQPTPSTTKGGVGSNFADLKEKLISITGGFKPVPPALGNGMQAVKAGNVSALQATAAAPKPPQDVLAALDKAIGETKSPALKADLEKMRKAIADGDPATAWNIGKRPDDQQVAAARSDAIEALPEGSQEQLATILGQLEFVSTLRDAKVDASYPPTEKQLTQYFGKLKGDPDAALGAYKDYVNNFHVHPANDGDSKGDVLYGKNGTKAPPTKWSDVANRPPSKDNNVGKQLNDCEGYAFLGAKLLGAAGFKVQNHLTANLPGNKEQDEADRQHAIVTLKHPKQGEVVAISNDRVFSAETEKAAADQGLEYANGGPSPRRVFYRGATAEESYKHFDNPKYSL